MNIKNRKYKLFADFDKAHRFLVDTYDFETLNGYLLPQYFEYAHHLQWFDFLRAHRCGLWEEGGELVGIACYEMNIGDCNMHTKKGYEFLLPEMLIHAEKELSAFEEGKHKLSVWITDKEINKRELLKENGYHMAYTEPVKVFFYENPFHERTLPEGFNLIDGTDIDYAKLSECFWRGFDHDEVPPKINIEGNYTVWNAPNADKSLMTIVVAPSGEYACALGMWYDKQNKYAYLEPLATVPKYRRLGLATAALTQAMKKTKALGATYCFGGGGAFYTSIGFEHICNRELWEKEW